MPSDAQPIEEPATCPNCGEPRNVDGLQNIALELAIYNYENGYYHDTDHVIVLAEYYRCWCGQVIADNPDDAEKFLKTGKLPDKPLPPDWFNPDNWQESVEKLKRAVRQALGLGEPK
jgi:hypothetical protein